MVGIAIESLLDGLAISTEFRVAPTPGLMMTLTVFIHEIPRGLTTTTIKKQTAIAR